jgi:hypothetical protein
MGAYISSIMETRFSREDEHRAKVRQAAECLISPAPAWLIKVLSVFSFDICTQHGIEEMSLTRKDLFKSVTSAQSMAIGLIEFLQTPLRSSFISAHTTELDEDLLRQQVEPLQEVVRGMQSVRASMLNARGKVRSGRGKALLPSQMAARYTCAAIVSEAAGFLEQKGLAAPSKTKMKNSAGHLWTSLLPPLEGWGRTRSPSWNIYFKGADDPRLSALRREVHRHLSIGMTDSSRRK